LVGRTWHEFISITEIFGYSLVRNVYIEIQARRFGEAQAAAL